MRTPDSTPGSRKRDFLRAGVADLLPAHFALSMATGIISLAAHFLGFAFLSRILFGLNIFFYLILWALLILRLIYFFSRFRADLGDHTRGMGFFTVVAATCILGNQAAVIGQDFRAALALFIFGIALWGGLIYGIFTALITRGEKPSLGRGINGSWMISVVGTQAVSVLAGINAAQFHPEGLIFLSLLMFLLGAFLYLIIITLILYRFFFFPLGPAELVPSYWVNMGAAAITTLAGAILVLQAPLSPLLVKLLPFVLGLTLFFWAAATWWIPLLAVLWVWRHAMRREEFTYTPLYWSLVFPLGMYTVCTFRLSQIPGLELVSVIPPYFLYFALLGWVLALVGMVRRVWRTLSLSPK